MAITYPLSLPNHDFQSFDIRLTRRIGTTVSPFTYQAQHHEHTGTRWEANVTLPPLTESEAVAWQIFFLSLKGTVGTFKMHPPLDASQNSVEMQVFGSHSAGDTSVTFKKTNTGSGTVSAGTWVQINNSGVANKPHLYLTLSNLSFGGQFSTDTCDIEPPLKHDPLSANATPMNPPYGLWRLATPDVGFSINNASLHGFTFACVEADL